MISENRDESSERKSEADLKAANDILQKIHAASLNTYFTHLSTVRS